jgi:GR25 family glycosyltransferase involved in LPS biosynthesis
MNDYPIYCINLEHRTDRKSHSLNQFKQMGIASDNVIYPHFIKDKRGGVFGCFDSHMKVWTDFFEKHPDSKYALIFEDDFIVTEKSASILIKATEFIGRAYNNIDILVLHKLGVNVNNDINNNLFTNGYGFGLYAYFITRHYIQSIINKYGGLPEPNGRHIDYEINLNIIDKDNRLYTNKIFYTNDTYFNHLIDKSDNYLNVIDEMFRGDMTKLQRISCDIMIFARKYTPINDNRIRHIVCIINNIITNHRLKSRNQELITN